MIPLGRRGFNGLDWFSNAFSRLHHATGGVASVDSPGGRGRSIWEELSVRTSGWWDPTPRLLVFTCSHV